MKRTDEGGLQPTRVGTGSVIRIGEILGPHGIQGEVRVYPLTDHPDAFATRGEMTLVPPTGHPGSATPVVATSCRVHKGIAVLRLSGVASRAEAEALRGWHLSVDPNAVIPLPKGRYYVFQLVGLRVETMNGRLVGTLKDVLFPGANDVYVVEEETTGKEVLIPAIRQVVREVCLDEGRMLIDPIPGLLDEAEEGSLGAD